MSVLALSSISTYSVVQFTTSLSCSFFFNDTATTEIYTLSLHDALPIQPAEPRPALVARTASSSSWPIRPRSEEHTSELQSPDHLVCRLLLEQQKSTKVLQHHEKDETHPKHTIEQRLQQ